MQKQLFKRIINESIPALILAAFIHVTAGTAMQLNMEIWVAIPVFLMLVPPISDLGNDVACIVSSRITTLLALGIVEAKLKRNTALEENLVAIMIIGVLSSLYLGAINFVIANRTGLGSIQILPFLAVCVAAVTILTFLVSLISIGVAFMSWRRGLDPDNVTIPISTSISDVLGIFSLLIAIRLIVPF